MTTTAVTTTTTSTTTKAAATTTKVTTTTKAAAATKAAATTTKASVAATKAASTTAKPSTTVTYVKGEYYCPDSRTVTVYSEDGKETAAVLEEGNIVDVVSVSGDTGEVVINSKKCRVKLSELVFAGKEKKLVMGDINNDGAFDGYDLALINEYIISRSRLPEGVSVLTGAEIAAADISGDGLIDNTDVLMYLMRICN